MQSPVLSARCGRLVLDPLGKYLTLDPDHPTTPHTSHHDQPRGSSASLISGNTGTVRSRGTAGMAYQQCGSGHDNGAQCTDTGLSEIPKERDPRPISMRTGSRPCSLVHARDGIFNSSKGTKHLLSFLYKAQCLLCPLPARPDLRLYSVPLVSN